MLCGEVVAADRDRHPAALLREVDRGLPGRVAAADHDHVGAAADPRFEIGRRVVHAGAFEPFEVVDREALVARARRDDHRCGTGSRCRRRARCTWKPFSTAQAGDLARRVQPGAEPLRLDRGA